MIARVRPQEDPANEPEWLPKTVLLPDENAAEYDELRRRLRASVKPMDFVEELLVEEAAHAHWLVHRYSRLQNEVLKSRQWRALIDILEPLCEAQRVRQADTSDDESQNDEDDENEPSYVEFSSSEIAETYARRWARQEPGAVNMINSILANANLGKDVIWAKAFMNNLEDIKEIQALIVQAKQARDGALFQVERHRVAAAVALRREFRLSSADVPCIEASVRKGNDG